MIRIIKIRVLILLCLLIQVVPAHTQEKESNSSKQNVSIAQGESRSFEEKFSLHSKASTMSLEIKGNDEEFVDGSLDSWSQNASGPVTAQITLTVSENAPIRELSIELKYYYTTSGSAGLITIPWTINVIKEGYEIEANFSAPLTSGTDPFELNFQNESSGIIATYHWDFGDGNQSYEENPVHIYTEPGSYSVSLKVANDYHSDSLVREDYISVLESDSITAAFASDKTRGIAPLIVQFTDQSTGPVGEWLWDFGDGTTSTEKNPEHTFLENGEYNVRLNVTSGEFKDSAHAIITVVFINWTFQLELPRSITWGDHLAIGNNNDLVIAIEGSLYSITQNGELRWSKDISDRDVSSQVRVDGNGIIHVSNLSTSYEFYPGGKLKTEDTHRRDMQAIGRKNESYHTNNFYINNEQYSYARCMDTNGDTLWNTLVENDELSGTALGRDGTFYLSMYNMEEIHALNPDGTLKWKTATAGSPGSISLADEGTIYYSSTEGWDSYLNALNPDGTSKWKYAHESYCIGSPLIDHSGNIYQNGIYGDISCISPSGTLNWRKTPLEGEDLDGDMVLGAQNIFCGSRNKMIALHLNGEVDWIIEEDQDTRYVAHTIGRNGDVYFLNETGMLYSVNTGNNALMKSAWPMRFANIQLTNSSAQFAVPIEESAANESVSGYFTLYPNPASSRVNIKLNPNENSEAILQIVSISGQLVHMEIYEGNASKSIELETESWEKGIYLVTIKQNKSLSTKRLVIL